ncbi:MAG: HAMP domain-containing protein [Chlorobiaceae bacterium]|nr:HAMP domain-containing protein [Chlorobiaceae bacterium]
MKRAEVNPSADRGLSAGARHPSLSLRNRIAFYYTVTTALLMALVFAVILFSINRIIYLHFDQDLRHEASETMQNARLSGKFFSEMEGFAEPDSGTVRSSGNKEAIERLNSDSGFIQLVNRKGRVFARSQNLDNHTLEFNTGYSGVRFYNGAVGIEQVRAIQVPLINKKGETDAWLVVAVPTGNIIRIFLDLKNIMLASFPVIILFLFILTRAIAGRSIRPVEEVIATAETLTQENFGQRIPLPGKQDELYRLSVTINALLDRLQEAFEREKHFTADASHELRTPLAVLKGTLEVLIRKPRVVDHYEEKIRYCLYELHRMSRLVDQLLILARYEQGSVTLHIAPMEFSSALESVLSRMEPLALEKRISFLREKQADGMVSADPAMLDMILENILSNAIKFSPAGSSIDIDVVCQSGLLVCTITDHGPGIPQEKLLRVFDRFYRADESRSSGTGGFGLGLSIVRKLSDLQHIGVSATSREHEGSTFRLVFQQR